MAEEELVQGEVYFAQLAERLLVDLSGAKGSVEEYKSKRAIIRRHLVPQLGALLIRDVDLSVVQRYKQMQLERGLSRKTINNHLVVLRAVLALALARGVIEAAPPIQSFTLEAPDLHYLGFEETRRLIQAADPEWRLMIILALRTGLRLGELRALSWEHVDLENLRLYVHGRGRQAKSREIPLSPETVLELRQHPRRGAWVFSTPQGEMLSHGACKWPLYRAARRAGLRQLGWDVLRRTFAAHLTLRGAPLASVQALLGNRSLSTTLRYTQLGAQGARAAIALLDVRDPSGAALQRALHQRSALQRAALQRFSLQRPPLSSGNGSLGSNLPRSSLSNSSNDSQKASEPWLELPPARLNEGRPARVQSRPQPAVVCPIS